MRRRWRVCLCVWVRGTAWPRSEGEEAHGLRAGRSAGGGAGSCAMLLVDKCMRGGTPKARQQASSSARSGGASCSHALMCFSALPWLALTQRQSCPCTVQGRVGRGGDHPPWPGGRGGRASWRRPLPLLRPRRPTSPEPGACCHRPWRAQRLPRRLHVWLHAPNQARPLLDVALRSPAIALAGGASFCCWLLLPVMSETVGVACRVPSGWGHALCCCQRCCCRRCCRPRAHPRRHSCLMTCQHPHKVTSRCPNRYCAVPGCRGNRWARTAAVASARRLGKAAGS